MPFATAASVSPFAVAQAPLEGHLGLGRGAGVSPASSALASLVVVGRRRPFG